MSEPARQWKSPGPEQLFHPFNSQKIPFAFHVGAHPRVRPTALEKSLNNGRTQGSAPTGSAAFCE